MQHKGKIIIEAALIIMVLCGCAGTGHDRTVRNTAENPSASEDKLQTAGLEASDTAVYTGKTSDGKAGLTSCDNGMEYTLSVNDRSTFADNYGSIMVLDQFIPGEIVDVSLSVHSKQLLTMQLNAEAFEKDDISNYAFNTNKGVMTINADNYKVTENTVVLENGKKAEIADIESGDILTARGIGHDIYSVTVESGSGHVRITGTEYFTGGWVEIGKDIIKPISDDMLLDVPEGEYDMRVTYNGYGGTKHISVTRGQETVVDVSDLKGELLKTGQITFTILPENVMPSIKINGEEIDYMQPVSLEYGVYNLEVSAPGYTTVRKYISVGTEMANIEIELEVSASANTAKTSSSVKAATSSSSSAGVLPSDIFKNISSSGSSASSSTSSSSVSSDTTSTGSGKLYIDAPSGAELYYDGSYKGIVPCSFKKTAGTHVITLRKDGYITKTYTITLDNTTDNETYSFGAMTASGN